MQSSDLDRPWTFGPSALAAMSAAYDEALGRMEDAGNLHRPVARESRRYVAVAIIEAEKAGIVDVARLKEVALSAIVGGTGNARRTNEDGRG